MVNKILNVEKLEQTLQANWANFLDHVQVMRIVMETVRDTEYKVLRQKELPQNHTQITVTRFALSQGRVPFRNECSQTNFEVWIEFVMPKGDGVVVGTNTYLLDLTGGFSLKQSFGTHFLPKNS